MSTPPKDSSDALRLELAETQAREAHFRAEAIRELRSQTTRLQELNHALLAERQARAERDGYVHQLHLTLEQLRRERAALNADLERYARRLNAAQAEQARLSEKLGRMLVSASWQVTAPLRAVRRLFVSSRPPTPPPVASTPPAGAFTYFLESSPYRISDDAPTVLRGWAVPSGSAAAVTGVRLRVGEAVFTGRHGLAAPEVVAAHRLGPPHDRPAFEIAYSPPPGPLELRLEAQLDGGTWHVIAAFAHPGAPA